MATKFLLHARLRKFSHSDVSTARALISCLYQKLLVNVVSLIGLASLCVASRPYFEIHGVMRTLFSLGIGAHSVVSWHNIVVT